MIINGSKVSRGRQGMMQKNASGLARAVHPTASFSIVGGLGKEKSLQIKDLKFP